MVRIAAARRRPIGRRCRPGCTIVLGAAEQRFRTSCRAAAACAAATCRMYCGPQLFCASATRMARRWLSRSASRRHPGAREVGLDACRGCPHLLDPGIQRAALRRLAAEQHEEAVVLAAGPARQRLLADRSRPAACRAPPRSGGPARRGRSRRRCGRRSRAGFRAARKFGLALLRLRPRRERDAAARARGGGRERAAQGRSHQIRFPGGRFVRSRQHQAFECPNGVESLDSAPGSRQASAARAFSRAGGDGSPAARSACRFHNTPQTIRRRPGKHEDVERLAVEHPAHQRDQRDAQEIERHHDGGVAGAECAGQAIVRGEADDAERDDRQQESAAAGTRTARTAGRCHDAGQASAIGSCMRFIQKIDREGADMAGSFLVTISEIAKVNAGEQHEQRHRLKARQSRAARSPGRRESPARRCRRGSRSCARRGTAQRAAPPRPAVVNSSANTVANGNSVTASAQRYWPQEMGAVARQMHAHVARARARARSAGRMATSASSTEQAEARADRQDFEHVEMLAERPDGERAHREREQGAGHPQDDPAEFRIGHVGMSWAGCRPGAVTRRRAGFPAAPCRRRRASGRRRRPRRASGTCRAEP